MLETSDGNEINLGPLKSEVVGEKIRAIKLTGPWAFCLDPAFLTEGYIKEMYSRSGGSRSINNLRSLVGGTADPDDIGRIVQPKINSSRELSEYDDGKQIRVQRQGFLEHRGPSSEIPVEIVAIRDGIAIGVPALEKVDSSEVEPGDVVQMVIQDSTEERDTAIGFSEDTGYPVHATDLVAPSGTTACVGVLNVFNTHLDTSPTALPPEIWPEEGAVVYVTVGRIKDTGEGYGFTDGLPARISDALTSHSAAEYVKAQVTERKPGILEVAVDELGPDERPLLGDVIQSEVVHREDNGTLCCTNDVPIWIPGSIPSPIENIKCRITSVETSHLVGSVAECPEVQRLEESETFQILVEHQDETNGVGSLEGIPVVVTGGQHLVGEKVALGLIEKRAGYLLAGINVVPGVPNIGEEITISEAEYRSRNGRLCFVESVPVLLPEGSDWPPGDIRIGVEDVTPAGIQVSITRLSSESRPSIGDEVEILTSDLEPGDNKVLSDGIPLEVPPNLWQWSGTVRLGVNGIQSNCLRCSIQGLPDSLIPKVGDSVRMNIDSVSEESARGRVSGIPARLLKTERTAETTEEVLIVGHDDNSLIAVEIEASGYDLGIESEAVADYYRALMEAREAWQEDDFELAIQRCRDADDVIETDSYAGEILRLDTTRQETLLFGEQVRTNRGVREAQTEVEEKIDSLSLPDVPAASWMIKELEAYRFTLTGISQDGSMTSGYLNATTRTIGEAQKIKFSPWKSIIPHPLFATLLASVKKPRSPSAEEADQLVDQAPQYWPFLALSEVYKAVRQ